MKTVLYFFAFFLVCGQASGKSLCHADEKIAFSCEIEGKNVSACVTSEETVKYVYGTEDKVELELKSPLFSSGMCSGGGISRLRFKHGNYSYIVYDVMCNTTQISEDQWGKKDFAGLMVLNDGKVVLNKECTGFFNDVFGVNSSVLPKSIRNEDFNYELP